MEDIKCSNCGSIAIVKRGFFTTTSGKQQRYYCKSCNKKFIPHTAFYRMRNTPQKITLCIDLFYRGISTRKIQEHLKAFYPHNSSNVSIYKWIVKYSKMISQFTDNLKLSVGKELQVDEVQFNRRKFKNKRGVDSNWFIDSIDTETRFMVSSDFAKSRDEKSIKKVLARAKKKTENQFKYITSDGFHAYQGSVKSVFGYYSLKKKEIEHNVVTASSGEGFNYPIERLHNNLRARTKTFRGFHGSLESANAIMKGWSIFYNFISKHQGIGCCPYQLAIPTLQLNPENKWLQLITLSSC